MIIALPILVPLVAAAVCLAGWGRVRLHRLVATGAALLMVIASVTLLVTVHSDGVQAVQIGSWSAPIGITLVADLFSAIMTLLASIVALAVVCFSWVATDDAHARGGHYALSLVLVGAVCGAFLTGDLFNLYVWFELLLLASFVLLTLGGERGQLEGAVKYVTLNLLSSVVFLVSIGLVYGRVGSLNMADLAVRLDALPAAESTLLAAPLMLAFGIKAAVFPFFFWLPASYHTPPAAVSALFAGLLTKVGVYSIFRAGTLLFDQEWEVLGAGVLLFAAPTMLIGVLGAVAQHDMRRILSFHIVSQIGYMLMGLGVAMACIARDGPSDAAVLALAGAVFYIVHHIVVKTNLFLISGVVVHERGTSALDRVQGLATTRPFLAVLFLLSSLSLAGIPVLSGFWAKLALVRGGLDAGSFAIVAVSLVVSILTLFSMSKIWTSTFWGAADDHQAPTSPIRPMMIGPIVVLTVLSIAIGLGAAPVMDLAERTAEQLLDPTEYIDAVATPRPEDAG